MLTQEDVLVLTYLICGSDEDRHFLAGTMLRRFGQQRIQAHNFWVAASREESFLAVQGSLLTALPWPLFPPDKAFTAVNAKLLAEASAQQQPTGAGMDANWCPSVFKNDGGPSGGDYYAPVHTNAEGQTFIDLSPLEMAHKQVMTQLRGIGRAVNSSRGRGTGRGGGRYGGRGGPRGGEADDWQQPYHITAPTATLSPAPTQFPSGPPPPYHPPSTAPKPAPKHAAPKPNAYPAPLPTRSTVPAAECTIHDPVGGDVNDCLSAGDLDRLLGPLLGKRYIPARSVFDVRTGGKPPGPLAATIRQRLETAPWLLVPLHACHHWATGLFYTRDGSVQCTVYDSAPSHACHLEWCNVIDAMGFDRPCIKCHIRQPRFSNQCGLHVILIACLQGPSAQHLVLPLDDEARIDLGVWRKILAKHAGGLSAQSAQRLIGAIPDLQHLRTQQFFPIAQPTNPSGGGGPGVVRPKRDVQDAQKRPAAAPHMSAEASTAQPVKTQALTSAHPHLAVPRGGGEVIPRCKTAPATPQGAGETRKPKPEAKRGFVTTARAAASPEGDVYACDSKGRWQHLRIVSDDSTRLSLRLYYTDAEGDTAWRKVVWTDRDGDTWKIGVPPQIEKLEEAACVEIPSQMHALIDGEWSIITVSGSSRGPAGPSFSIARESQPERLLSAAQCLDLFDSVTEIKRDRERTTTLEALVLETKRPHTDKFAAESQPRAMLSTTTIDYCLASAAKLLDAKRTVICPHSFHSLVGGAARMTPQRWHERLLRHKTRFDAVETIVAIVHHNSHFVTFVGTRNNDGDPRVEVYDSLPSHASEERQARAKLFAEALEVWWGGKASINPSPLGPRQAPASNDCGLHALSSALTAALGDLERHPGLIVNRSLYEQMAQSVSDAPLTEVLKRLIRTRAEDTKRATPAATTHPERKEKEKNTTKIAEDSAEEPQAVDLRLEIVPLDAKQRNMARDHELVIREVRSTVIEGIVWTSISKRRGRVLAFARAAAANRKTASTVLAAVKKLACVKDATCTETPVAARRAKSFDPTMTRSVSAISNLRKARQSVTAPCPAHTVIPAGDERQQIMPRSDLLEPGHDTVVIRTTKGTPLSCPLCDHDTPATFDGTGRDNSISVHLWAYHRHNCRVLNTVACTCGCDAQVFLKAGKPTPHKGTICPSCTILAPEQHLCANRSSPSGDGIKRRQTTRDSTRQPMQRKLESGPHLMDPDDPPEALSEEAPPEPGFRSGEGSAALPPLAAAMQHHLTVLQNAAHRGPQMSRKGLSPDVITQHVNWLRKIGGAAASSPATTQPRSATEFIVELLTTRAKQRRWKWSTTKTAFATVGGACLNLPAYLPHARAWRLQDEPIWRLACRRIGISAASEIPTQSHELTPAQVLTACKASPKHLAAAMAITWITCGRTGSTLQLKGEDITMEDSGAVAVTWRRGKTVRMRQTPHTVHTEAGMFKEFISDLVRHTKPAEFLFPAPTRRARMNMQTDIKDALRISSKNPNTDNRSLRRGALITLAKAGAPASTLMHYSGHSTEATLRIYLGFGKFLESDKAKVKTHIKALTNPSAKRA
jgi:hypothetical protein